MKSFTEIFDEYVCSEGGISNCTRENDCCECEYCYSMQDAWIIEHNKEENKKNKKIKKSMNKNLRFEMRIAENTLERLQAIKKYYEKKFNKKISLAKTIEYIIDTKFIDIEEK